MAKAFVPGLVPGAAAPLGRRDFADAPVPAEHLEAALRKVLGEASKKL